jgi:hypothetical protein
VGTPGAGSAADARDAVMIPAAVINPAAPRRRVLFTLVILMRWLGDAKQTATPPLSTTAIGP